jgi:dihydroneopterin aldolase
MSENIEQFNLQDGHFSNETFCQTMANPTKNKWTLWDAWERLVPLRTDKVLIKNLICQARVRADAWGRLLDQIILISVEVIFKKAFNSAAAHDEIDTSTINYGTLSENILQNVALWGRTPELQSSVGSASESPNNNRLAALVFDAIRKTAGDVTAVGAAIVEITYPKGSLQGDGTSHTFGINYIAHVYAGKFHLRNLRLNAVVGLNPHERDRQQTIIVNVWVDYWPGCTHLLDSTQLEALVTEVSFHILLVQSNFDVNYSW